MNFLPQIQDGFHRWIDSVAGTIDSLLGRLRTTREVQIIEDEHDTFTLHAQGDGKKLNLPDYRVRIANGAVEGTLPSDWQTMPRGGRAEMILQPSRFLFRPLELPKRAVEFLDGIVRAQIDRLTPWTANEAIFSWTQPVDAANDRIELTVAAT